MAISESVGGKATMGSRRNTSARTGNGSPTLAAGSNFSATACHYNRYPKDTKLRMHLNVGPCLYIEFI